MLEAIRRWMRGEASGGLLTPEPQAATQLPPPAEPKVKPKQQSFPSYVQNTRGGAATVLPRTDLNLARTDALTLRTQTSTREVIRKLAKATPDLSAAKSAYLRTALTSSYTAKARNMDGTFNREATQLLHQLLTRFDIVQDYADGFSGIWSLRSASESLGGELLQYGACALELVLGKDRLPRALVPVSTTQIEWLSDDRWLRPIQRVGSEEIDLDLPTFFYVSLDQDLLEPYADSPFEAAIQPVIADHDFFDDLRRLVKRALHPRLDVQIDEEKFKKTIPPEILMDPVQLTAHVKTVMADIESKVNDLNPEDALVHFDFIKFDFLNHGNASPAEEEKTLLEITQQRMTSASRTLPSILGHGQTASLASAEAMLFMKSAAGMVQEKLNDIYSRALTLALRLFGLDVYVEFRYAPIDLRPENELEAFRTMKQSRVLEQLSLGFIEDDDASIELTGNVTPAGFKPLSGTNFRSPGAAAGDAGGNPYSTTGAQGNKQGPLNQGLKSDAPDKAKGPQK